MSVADGMIHFLNSWLVSSAARYRRTVTMENPPRWFIDVDAERHISTLSLREASNDSIDQTSNDDQSKQAYHGPRLE